MLTWQARAPDLDEGTKALLAIGRPSRSAEHTFQAPAKICLYKSIRSVHILYIFMKIFEAYLLSSCFACGRWSWARTKAIFHMKFSVKICYVQLVQLSLRSIDRYVDVCDLYLPELCKLWAWRLYSIRASPVAACAILSVYVSVCEGWLFTARHAMKLMKEPAVDQDTSRAKYYNPLQQAPNHSNNSQSSACAAYAIQMQTDTQGNSGT